ncbi:MAG TPA: hypothetical protein VFX91_01205 [Alcanivorax sp.]|nr:hypothetical protein [Alcanivorax sp.]
MQRLARAREPTGILTRNSCAAGMTACLLRNGGNRRFADQADLVIDHLSELLALAGLDQS